MPEKHNAKKNLVMAFGFLINGLECPSAHLFKIKQKIFPISFAAFFYDKSTALSFS